MALRLGGVAESVNSAVLAGTLPLDLALCKIEQWDHLTSRIDYGAGCPVSPADFARALVAAQAEAGLAHLRLVVEPGRSLVGPFGALVAAGGVALLAVGIGGLLGD